MDKDTIRKMQSGGSAPFDLQIAFNILFMLMAVQIYDSFLKDKYGGGRTIDELVGLK
jgi:hypothetical protein|tara:strand:- start:709 stop:879 length:171 start_codon:yes stop_codon:yes gene_type:complete